MNTLQQAINETLYHQCPNKKALKIGIEEELKAVTIYEALKAQATDQRVIDALDHVIEEEKHHAEEFQNLLAQL